MISYSEALDQIRAVAKSKRENFKQDKEWVSLEPEHAKEALTRFLSHDLLCPRAIPAFSNSAMDGYAVRRADLQEISDSGPWRFRVVDTIFAGDPRDVQREYPAKVAVEIMTGAPLPTGFDAVLKVEETQAYENEIEFATFPRAGEYVREAGSDYQPGDFLARGNTCLHPELILALASASFAKVPVFRKIKVAILSTGSELHASLDAESAPGKIPNSTAPYLAAALSEYGCEVLHFGSHPDDGKTFSEALRELCRETKLDLIITTGAVSKGKLDFVPHAVASVGAQVQFHGVAIKPGKPLLFASFEDQSLPAIFSVPGNPVSTVVALRFFVAAFIAELLGHPPEQGSFAKLSDPVIKPPALHCFWKSHWHASLSGSELTALEGQESYRVSSLVRANAWGIFAAGESSLDAGTPIRTFSLKPEFLNEEHHTKDCC